MYTIFDMSNRFAGLKRDEAAVYSRFIDINGQQWRLTVGADGLVLDRGVFAHFDRFVPPESAEQAELDDVQFSAQIQKQHYPRRPDGPGGRPIFGHAYLPVSLMELVQVLGIDPTDHGWKEEM